MNAAHRWPAPWAFSILMLPLGVYLGFIWTALPFLLGKAGLAVDQIAQISAFLQLPGVLLFLWTPVVDIKLRRRAWLLLGAFATALCLGIACLLLGRSHVGLLTAVLLAGGVVATLVPAACGGLMAKMLPAGAQPRASAWNQAGQLGGGAMGAAVAIWLAEHTPLAAVGLAMALLACLPAWLAWSVPEPAPTPSTWFRGRWAQLAREGLDLVRSPERRWSALLLLSPCCTGAAQGLLPALASHYSVGAAGVIWTNGLGGGVVLALGALSAGLIPSAWDRRMVYVSGGLLNALASVVLLVSNRPAAYVIGTLFYLLTTGFCWARFLALALEIIGSSTQDASTWFGVLTSAGTIPVMGMIWFDGQGFQKLGVHGVLWTDAAPNFLLFAMVAALVAVKGRAKAAVCVPEIIDSAKVELSSVSRRSSGGAGNS